MFSGLKKKISEKIVRIAYTGLMNMDKRLKADLFRELMQKSHDGYKEEVLSKYKIHPSVRFSFGTQMYGDGNIEIGEGTYFGENCFVQSQAPASVTIGKYCAIAHNIHIRTSDYKKTLHLKDALKSEGLIRNITIGDYVWIGANVYINGGITIGDNCIIGANSVVTKNVEPNSIVGGVPAKLICFKDEKYISK